MPGYHPPCYPALVTSREGRLVVETENTFKERGLDIHPNPSIKGEVQRLRPRYTGGIGSKVGTCLQKRRMNWLSTNSLIAEVWVVYKAEPGNINWKIPPISNLEISKGV